MRLPAINRCLLTSMRLSLLTALTIAASAIVNNTTASTITTTEQQPDPSLIPLRDGSDAIERYRIVADINQDGQPDLILSDNIRWFGTGGGLFSVYLNENGNYRKIGEIGANPLALALEHFDGSHKIWCYWRSGYTGGEIGYYEVRDGKLLEFRSIEIHPNDGGTDLGRRIYNIVFAEPFRLKAEISTTDGDTVAWKPFLP